MNRRAALGDPRVIQRFVPAALSRLGSKSELNQAFFPKGGNAPVTPESQLYDAWLKASGILCS